MPITDFDCADKLLLGVRLHGWGYPRKSMQVIDP
jgi:hypothetical protein